jgi:glutamate decarboxylase
MALHTKVDGEGLDAQYLSVSPLFAPDGESTTVPKHRMPDQPMAADMAYEIIHDELMLDGNARLNLATFVTTWMEPQAEKLMAECLDKNMIDKDEYPQTAELEMRCVNMLSRLWNSPSTDEATGCSTTGSSEAAMLGGMALKRRWQQRRRAAGKSTERPNMVMGINVQICWEKFCNYFEVEPRYEPVQEISDTLDDLQERTGLDVPIHVDGASGGMIAPFIDPDLVWDFRLPRVASINTSGHKYGRVYPGVGWALWRDPEALPDDLVFRVNYLGGDMPTFALNFSRPGAQIVAQYYNFLRLGFEGYRRVQQECRDMATYVSGAIAELGPFELITDGSELPVFAFKVRDEVEGYSAFDVSSGMRERGWQVPAYSFPENREDLVALRVVVRNGYSRDPADIFLDDLKRLLERLEKQSSPAHDESYTGFAH